MVVVAVSRGRRGALGPEAPVHPENQDVGVLGAQIVLGLDDLRVTDERADIEAPRAGAPVVANVGVESGPGLVARLHDPAVAVDPESGRIVRRERTQADARHAPEGRPAAVGGEPGVARRAACAQAEGAQLDLQADDLAYDQLRRHRATPTEAVLRLLRLYERVGGPGGGVDAHLLGERGGGRRDHRQRDDD